MSKDNKFSPEVRERAVRLVQEHRGEYRPVLAYSQPSRENAVLGKFKFVSINNSLNRCYRVNTGAPKEKRCALSVGL